MLSLEKLVEMNHWWKLGQVKEIFVPSFKRSLFYEIQKYARLRHIIAVIGLRRVGKTTLLYQTIREFIGNKVDPRHILYFSFDEECEEIRDILKLYHEKILGKTLGEEKIYVFLDEIQKLKDWQNKIKVLYDLYPTIKFLISGSASLNILLKAKESLAGRIFYLYADLLSFHEFLELKGKEKFKQNPDLWKEDLKIELNNYLLRPFPEIVNADDDLAKKYIREGSIEKAIFRDLTSLFEIKDVELIEKLVHLLAANPGMIVNLDDLSKDFNRSRQVISNYLYYLECCFLVKGLRNFRGSLKSSSRKLKRYYLLHPALGISLEFPDIGRSIENLVMFKTKADYFWREKEKEVDFVVSEKRVIRPVESKYTNNIREKDIKGLLKFMDLFGIKEGLVITEGLEKEEVMGGVKIKYIPLWKWLLS